MPENRFVQARPLTLAELVVLLVVAWALWAMGAHAQTVPIKTTPLATGSQLHELRMLRSDMDVRKDGCVDVLRLHTSTLPHIHTHKRPKAD